MVVSSVNIHEAKTHFSKLIERVLMGEEVVIARAGRPVAKLVPFTDGREPRKPGSAKGLFEVPEGFDDPLPPEIQRHFE